MAARRASRPAFVPVKASEPLDATVGVAAGAAAAAGAAEAAPAVAADTRGAAAVVRVTAWQPDGLVMPATPEDVSQGVPVFRRRPEP